MYLFGRTINISQLLEIICSNPVHCYNFGHTPLQVDQYAVYTVYTMSMFCVMILSTYDLSNLYFVCKPCVWAPYSSSKALGERIWLMYRFHNFDIGSEIYDLFLGNSGFSYFRVLCDLFNIMHSLMYSVFACMSVMYTLSVHSDYIQSIIPTTSHTSRTRTLHCSYMSMTISRDLFCLVVLISRCTSGFTISTGPSDGNLFDGSRPLYVLIWRILHVQQLQPFGQRL